MLVAGPRWGSIRLKPGEKRERRSAGRLLNFKTPAAAKTEAGCRIAVWVELFLWVLGLARCFLECCCRRR